MMGPSKVRPSGTYFPTSRSRLPITISTATKVMYLLAISRFANVVESLGGMGGGLKK